MKMPPELFDLRSYSEKRIFIGLMVFAGFCAILLIVMGSKPRNRINNDYFERSEIVGCYDEGADIYVEINQGSAWLIDKGTVIDSLTYGTDNFGTFLSSRYIMLAASGTVDGYKIYGKANYKTFRFLPSDDASELLVNTRDGESQIFQKRKCAERNMTDG